MIAGAGAFAGVAILMGLGVLALPWWTPLAVFAVGVGVALPFEAANVYGHAVAGVSPTARILPCVAYAIGLMVREAGWMPAIMADAYPMVERVSSCSCGVLPASFSTRLTVEARKGIPWAT